MNNSSFFILILAISKFRNTGCSIVPNFDLHPDTRRIPGKSFGLKFIPNHSVFPDSFQNLYPRQSEIIRFNPKKVFNLV